MNSPKSDRAFAGSIPQLYDQYLVPLIFEPYAIDIADRVQLLRPATVLELAAGTGVATRQLSIRLPTDVSIVATDLNQPMLDHATVVGTVRPVTWQQADAMTLPFPDQSFDVIACQFGVMFFPDRAAAFAEARRVLCPGGTLIFNVWDRIELNEFADVVTTTLAQRFPKAPPRFLARLPHGYFDDALIAQDLLRGGFHQKASFTTVAARSRAASPRIPAIAYCQGTPLRNEIEARDASGLDEATELAASALADRFGNSEVEGGIQARVIAINR